MINTAGERTKRGDLHLAPSSPTKEIEIDAIEKERIDSHVKTVWLNTDSMLEGIPNASTETLLKAALKWPIELQAFEERESILEHKAEEQGASELVQYCIQQLRDMVDMCWRVINSIHQELATRGIKV